MFRCYMTDEISKQLQVAIKSQAGPQNLAAILTAFNLSKNQYKISHDLRSESVYLCKNPLQIFTKYLLLLAGVVGVIDPW